MSKYRSYSIVIHNVKDDSKSSVTNHFKSSSPTRLLVAMEPYPQDEGYHIHVFVSFKSQRSFKSILSTTQSLATVITTPCPEGETRDWGRVQVDQMRGTFEQATAYLTNPKKEKECDPSLTNMNVAYEDDKFNFELATRLLNKSYFYPDRGQLLTAHEYIILQKNQDKDIDSYYEHLFNVFNLGPPKPA